LAQEAHVFLLDEPFTGLDKPTQESLRRLLRELREQGKLIIASHHDLASVPDLFDQVLLLNGELIAAGPVASTFTESNIEKTYSTRVFAALAHGMAV
jgi:ABC-type Mn2+/Zn2+ transport system ATPase subunit